MNILINLAPSFAILLVSLYQGWREVRLRRERRELQAIADAMLEDLKTYRRVLKEETAKLQDSVTCPRCGRTSHNPDDIGAGYCGHCHDWTGEP